MSFFHYFFHNHSHDNNLENLDEQNFESPLLVYVTAAAVLVSSILCSLKFWGAAVTCSHAMRCSAHDSLMDVRISFINFVTVILMKYIPQKKLVEKFAAIITFGQGCMVLYLTYFLMQESYEKFFEPTCYLHGVYNIVATTIFSLFLNLILVQFQDYTIKKTNVSIIKADKVHFQSDFFMNFSVLLGLLASFYLNIHWLDAFMGLFCSVYLIVMIIPLMFFAVKKLFN